MLRDTNTLIDELADGLEPIEPMRFGHGLACALTAAAVSALAVVGLLGLRSDLLSGQFNPVHLIATGLFLVLGIAASVAVIAMSCPRVGSDHGGWVWAAAMTALLPVAALIVGFAGTESMLSPESVSHGLDCLMMGTASSTLVFAVLVWWLRRGAPTSPERAGLLTGIAAGSLGIFAFSLNCADNDIVHIGLWHTGAVIFVAALGRAVVPRLVRW